jgi:hypothetical protein
VIHLVFERPQQTLKAFHFDRTQRFVWKASGAATPSSRGAMPEGHYILLEPELFGNREPGTGWGRVRIRDMTDRDVTVLEKAGFLKHNGDLLDIGSIALAAGRCDAYGRFIEIHGGGSALAEPQAPMQELCRTLGCTRMHNLDLNKLIDYMKAFGAENTFVFSVMGRPAPCPC